MQPELLERATKAWERSKGTKFLQRGDGKIIHSLNGFFVHAIEAYVENVEAATDADLNG